MLKNFFSKSSIALLSSAVALTTLGQQVKAAILTAPVISLDQVLSSTGNKWQVDGVYFYDFTYSATGGAQPTNPINVNLSSINVGGEVGFRLNGLFTSGSNFGDIVIAYIAEAINPLDKFDSANLGIGGISSGTVRIVENYGTSVTNVDNLGTIIVDNNPLTSQGTSGSTNFTSPTNKFFAQKDVQMDGVPDFIEFSIITQTTNDPNIGDIPEPSSVLALGLIGGSLLLSRKNKNESAKS